MATIKLIFRESSVAGGEGSLFLRVIHRRKTRHIQTGCHIFSSEWDDRHHTVRHTEDVTRTGYLDSAGRKINDKTIRLNTIITNLERSKQEYSVDDILERYQSSETVVGFISFALRQIKDTRHLGKPTTAEHYASALSSLIRYHGNREIPFEQLDHKLISGYESYLRNLNLSPNTTSYYMRSLRSIYNHAVEQELTIGRNPFRHVYTGVAKTVKRSLPVEMFKALHRLKLNHDPLLQLARDMFIFSVYTRGMAFIDIAYLKKSNIRNGFLTYRRHKTARQLVIRWEDSMQKIADRYRSEKSEYIFPLIKSAEKDVRRQYLNAYKSLSRRLHRLGEMIGISEALTFHRARHTWASVARSNHVPISVIREGMGHDSERTTEIYLASLDSDDVDNANSAIIGLLSQ